MDTKGYILYVTLGLDGIWPSTGSVTLIEEKLFVKIEVLGQTI